MPLILKKSKKVDPHIAKIQLAALQYLHDLLGRPAFCRWTLYILTKKDIRIQKKLTTRLIPFTLSTIQHDLWNTKGLRNITLKPRQIGSTTYHILVRLFLSAILEPGSSGLLISQTKAYGAQHFRILQRAVKNFSFNQTIVSTFMRNLSQNSLLTTQSLKENLLHTQYSARHEIVFDWLDSKVLVDTAENPDAGTGLTINHLVATEVAYWSRDPESLLSQAKEAVPLDGTVDYESTPNGMGGYFFEEWQRAQEPGAEFKSHFYPWWWQEEFQADKEAEESTVTAEEERLMAEVGWTLRQLEWRRQKQVSLRGKFVEKYPEDSSTCVYGNSVVVLANGKKVPISTLVKNRYSGKVMTLGSDGKLTTAKVINWYRTGRRGRKVYRMEYEHATASGFGKSRGVTLTEEHKVLTIAGWKRADECSGRMVATGTPAPGPRAFQLIIGTLLGDSCISKRSLTCSQIAGNYIKLKARLLKGLGGKERASIPEKGNRKKTFCLSTVCLPYFAWLRKKFYPEGKKRIPRELVSKIDDFGIAVWFMDDGWTNLSRREQSTGTRPTAGISLGILPEEDGRWLAELLGKRGYPCTWNEDKNGHCYLYIGCDTTEKLLRNIAKYLPVSMRYKLPRGYQKFEKKWFEPEAVETFFDKALVKEIQPPKQKSGKYEKGPFYCLDVEGTHNFVTLGGVVHNCFLTSGDLFFDKDRLRWLKLTRDKDKPLESYHDGTLLVYKRRIKGRRYIIGADVAEGKLVSTDNSDWSTACVLDLDTGEEMASYRSKQPPEEFAADLVQIGNMYNTALLAPERNGMGMSVLTSLRQLMYGNIYSQKELPREFTRGQKLDPTNVRRYDGFPTTPRTRPAALNELAKRIRDAPEFWHDRKFIDEALTFVWRFSTRNAKFGGKRVPQAQEGCHDDTVMARAIACLARLIELKMWDPIESASERYGDFGEEEEEAA